MSLKKRTVTPSLLRKYEVLRYIWFGPKTAEELFTACSNMEKRQVITALANLLDNHAIKKENIPEEKATDEFFNEGPKRIKKKSKNRYAIIPNGRHKLAYWEWKYQLHTEIQPNAFPWNDSFNEPYYEEMKKIIIEDLKLPT